MYDPLKGASALEAVGPKIRTMAPPGSLLKVWEGNLEILKDNTLKVMTYSTIDVQAFQQLPEI